MHSQQNDTELFFFFDTEVLCCNPDGPASGWFPCCNIFFKWILNADWRCELKFVAINVIKYYKECWKFEECRFLFMIQLIQTKQKQRKRDRLTSTFLLYPVLPYMFWSLWSEWMNRAVLIRTLFFQILRMWYLIYDFKSRSFKYHIIFVRFSNIHSEPDPLGQFYPQFT